jgi:hypothetical protein
VQEELRQLTFVPGQVDTFIAQFESLAGDANYPIDTQNTLTLFVAKLPYKMMSHIILNIKPMTFRGWADAARAFHKDNVAVQNIAAINEGSGWKKTPFKKGFMARQLAQILNVKMPVDPNAMDTRTDRTRSFNKFKRSNARATITEDPLDKQRKEGRCFICNKQGHMQRNCPDKSSDKKKSKAKQTKAEDSSSESETEDDYIDQFITNAWAMKESSKKAIIKKAIITEQGEEGGELDF